MKQFLVVLTAIGAAALASSALANNGGGKVLVSHKGREMLVERAAVEQHFRHGDFLVGGGSGGGGGEPTCVSTAGEGLTGPFQDGTTVWVEITGVVCSAQELNDILALSIGGQILDGVEYTCNYTSDDPVIYGPDEFGASYVDSLVFECTADPQ